MSEFSSFRKRFLLVFLFFYLGIGLLLVQGQNRIEGQITDAETTRPLPFATIRWAEGKGVVADKEGYFQLAISDKQLQLELRYVGYKPLQLEVLADTVQYLRLKMQQEEQALKEVVVLSGENPAHAIIREAVARREEHNPLRLPAYAYTSYNQFYLSMEPATDSPPSQDAPSDSVSPLQKLADSTYLFFNESLTQHQKQGRQERQKVLATQTAGSSSLLFTAVATDLQPFGFYENYIPLLDQEYLNPLSPNSFSRYDFYLADRLLTEIDTTFIITFSPRQGSNFRGLAGTLYINSLGYALRNVIAENAGEHAKLRLQIRQEYQRVEGHWFPSALKARWFLPEYAQEGVKWVAHVETTLKEVNLQPEKSLPFSRITNDFAADANSKDSHYWDSVRVKPLSPKAATTFVLMENNRLASMYNIMGRLMEALLTYRLPLGVVDVRLDDLGKYSKYEGFRPGLGLSTNYHFSRWLELGAYTGWGLRDKALKYRGHLRLNLHRPTGLYVQAAYLQDLREPGASDLLPLPGYSLLDNSGLRGWYLERLDSIRGSKLKLGFAPWLANVALEGGFDLLSVNPTYDYNFLRQEGETDQTSFALTEAYVQFAYRHKKKLAFMAGREVLLGYELPQLMLRLSRGRGGSAESFNYTRVEGLAEGRHHWRKLGLSHLQLMAGWVSGALPYHRLFSLRGSAGTDNLLDIDKTFRTMGVHEFVASVYTAAFYRHRIGRLKTGSKYIQPEFELAHHAVWSQLNSQGTHKGVALQATEKVFTEAGIQINDLLRMNYVNVAYLGIGGSVYFRYGAYAEPKPTDNLHYRLLMRLTFD